MLRNVALVLMNFSAFNGGEQTSPAHAPTAEIGSLSMEFTRLSQVTGDPKYFDATQRINDIFAHNKILLLCRAYGLSS